MSEHDDRLRELGTQLPWDRPDPARRDAVRSSLLVAAAERDALPKTRWYVIGGAFAAGAIAAAAAVLLLARAPRDEHPAPVSAAHIDASPTAKFDRQVTQTPTGVDEVVRLRAGSLAMSVGALRAGDHVRVATRDGEVEGEGDYAVEVDADELKTVTVTQGRATIRVTGQQAVFLASGQSWSAHAVITHAEIARADIAQTNLAPAPPPAPTSPVAAVPAVVEPAIVEPHAPAPHDVMGKPAAKHAKATTDRGTPIETTLDDDKRAEPPVATPAAPSEPPTNETSAPIATPAVGTKEVERRFQAGMTLLKAGKPSDAARELLAAADAGGDDPLAADARYFAATALTKAGRKTEAERALVAFMDRAPKSIRRGRAAVMLARLIAERGDTAAARAWFESALGDADGNVVAAARAGIAAMK